MRTHSSDTAELVFLILSLSPYFPCYSVVQCPPVNKRTIVAAFIGNGQLYAHSVRGKLSLARTVLSTYVDN